VPEAPSIKRLVYSLYFPPPNPIFSFPASTCFEFLFFQVTPSPSLPRAVCRFFLPSRPASTFLLSPFGFAPVHLLSSRSAPESRNPALSPPSRHWLSFFHCLFLQTFFPSTPSGMSDCVSMKRNFSLAFPFPPFKFPSSTGLLFSVFFTPRPVNLRRLRRSLDQLFSDFRGNSKPPPAQSVTPPLRLFNSCPAPF